MRLIEMIVSGVDDSGGWLLGTVTSVHALPAQGCITTL